LVGGALLEDEAPQFFGFLFGGRIHDVFCGVFHQIFRDAEIGVYFILTYAGRLELFPRGFDGVLQLFDLRLELFLHDHRFAAGNLVQQGNLALL